jgi:hypothetical protein
METRQYAAGDALALKVRRYLVIILIVSVILRLAAVAIMGNSVESLPGIDDQLSYHTLAQQVLGGHGFTMPENWWPLTRAGEPTAHWSYLYTLYLIAVYGVFGVTPLVARVLQVLIVGVLWPLLAFRIGRRLAGDTTGLIAAGWTALYGYFVYYSAALMTEPFYITAILWAFDLAMSDARAHPYRRWALLGLAAGLAVLLRQSFLTFLPFLLAWAWIMDVAARRSGEPGPLLKTAARALRFPALAVAVIAVLVLPWTVRNYTAFHRFILLNTNAGYAFFWANHPIYGTNFVGILPPEITYESLVPQELYSLDEAALDSALLKQGMEYVTQDPLRYALLSLSRFKTFFMFWPTSDSGLLSNLVRVQSFALALPFILYGMLIALKRWRDWSLLYLFGMIYSAVHLLSWALVRYRLPVDAVLVLFAAYGLNDLLQRIRQARVASPALAQR